MLRGTKKILTSIRSTRFSSRHGSNEYIPRSKMGSRRPFYVLGTAKLNCARVYVLIIFHCRIRPSILKICLVEAAYNKNPNDPIHYDIHPRISIILQKWMRLSNGNIIFYCLSGCSIFHPFCELLHQIISIKTKYNQKRWSEKVGDKWR